MNALAPLPTARLLMRPFTLADARFILELLNDPGFIHHIGDRHIRTIENAELYISEKLIASYQRHGYGLYLVSRSQDTVPIGMCGLVKRDHLAFPDIGFAFLESQLRQGYGFESASRILEFSQDVLKLPTVYGLTSTENVISMGLLEKLGLRFEQTITAPPSGEISRLYAIHYAAISMHER